jgi:SAM-dependent methyltransferase
VGHIEYLASVCDLQGRSIVDVGAGDGTFSRQLDLAGASVTAVEIDPIKVSRAENSLPSNINVLVGRAESLPVDNCSQDLACFFFSLHHVPVDLQDAAFDEVLRVLKPTGRLHIVEPYPYGSMFDVVRMVEDETAVRTHSHKILSRLGQGNRFRLLAHNDYVLTREYPSFDEFFDKIVRPDPERSKAFSRVADDMRHTFDRVVEIVDGVPMLHQPCAAYHFEIVN